MSPDEGGDGVDEGSTQRVDQMHASKRLRTVGIAAAVGLVVWVIFISVVAVGAIKVERLELHKPELTWLRCTCGNPDMPGNPALWGLNQDDYIKHQKYMVGLEHENGQCIRQ